MFISMELAAGPAPRIGSRHNSRVLVVDDEDVMRRLMTRAIGSAGHWCAATDSGEEAFELIERHSFDLAVLDKNLPDVSGIEITRRTRGFFRRFPVIIVTGYPTDESRREAEALGVSSYMVKPFDVEALRREVGLALDWFWRGSVRPPVAARSRPLPGRRSRPAPVEARRTERQFGGFENGIDLDAAVLIVEPDDGIRIALADVLGEAGFRVVAFSSLHQAEIHVQHQGFDVLLTPPELVESTQHWAAMAPGDPPLGTVAVVDAIAVDRHIAAIQAGARGVLSPPFVGSRVVARLGSTVAQLRRERVRLSLPKSV
jgi:two-component system response regulator (stage 0 sporulation protein F)